MIERHTHYRLVDACRAWRALPLSNWRLSLFHRCMQFPNTALFADVVQRFENGSYWCSFRYSESSGVRAGLVRRSSQIRLYLDSSFVSYVSTMDRRFRFGVLSLELRWVCRGKDTVKMWSIRVARQLWVWASLTPWHYFGEATIKSVYLIPFFPESRANGRWLSWIILGAMFHGTDAFWRYGAVL